MADKKLQNLNNERTIVVTGDQFAIGGADGFTYRANLNILQSFLLDSSLTVSTIKAPQSAVVKAAIDAISTTLTTNNASFNDFQKITDAIVAIQDTLSVDDANYDTLQEIADNLKAAETKLATIETDADVNVQPDWDESDNTNDAFINNKPTLGTASSKNIGTAIGDVQENGAILGNSETVETDATGKFITATKNTAYNANFGTSNTDVARGDASYLKAETYTQTEVDNALATNSTDDRARANHTGEQAISTITGLQTALDAKEATANKGVANGYAGLDSNAQVPLSQIPATAKSSKVVSDIATRDAIASADRFEGLRVHVLNATADTTVSSGSAGYILKSGLSNADWEKTYESESLDIDLSDYFNKTTNTTDDISVGTAKFTTQADIDKLVGIEANATADQTPAEIKTGYENNADTNAFTDAEKNKLANLAKADVGLGNVDNTSDTDKPISTAQQTALDGKLAKASNFSDVASRQTALDNLTNVATATNEYVLTKDTITGNAVFKPAAGGGSGTNLSTTITGTTVAINSDTGNDAIIPAATSSNAGVFTSADKTKLDGVEVNASSNKTGSIVMSIASLLSGALKFDGVSSYSKATYSSLYTILSNIVGTAFDVDANNFYLPDPAGRVFGIAGSGRTLFDLVGSDTHILDILEIPSHTHGNNSGSNNGDYGLIRKSSGDSDTITGSSLDVTAGEPDLTTDPIALTINSTGGGQAHNIVQKTAFIAQNLFIYY